MNHVQSFCLYLGSVLFQELFLKRIRIICGREYGCALKSQGLHCDFLIWICQRLNTAFPFAMTGLYELGERKSICQINSGIRDARGCIDLL